MKLKIEIEFGNAAMENLYDAAVSLDWLVQNLKNLHEQGYQIDSPIGGDMIDGNGNRVGSWDFEENEDTN